MQGRVSKRGGEERKRERHRESARERIGRVGGEIKEVGRGRFFFEYFLNILYRQYYDKKNRKHLQWRRQGSRKLARRRVLSTNRTRFLHPSYQQIFHRYRSL